MKMKISHRGPQVFKKNRRGPWRIIATVVGCVLLVGIGYFSMKYIAEHPQTSTLEPGETDSTNPSTETTGADAGEPDTTSPSTTTTTETPVAAGNASLLTGENIRGFYLPAAVLSNTSTLDSLLEEAAEAGFNTAVFDLKDENGVLHYVSATDLAVQAGSAADDALTLEELKTLAQRMESKGITPLPRVFAFKDHTAPSTLMEARIGLENQPGWMWLDNSKEAGGRPWLNPYSQQAQQYITDLCVELKDAGFRGLILDGVQFPNQQSQAYYGSGPLSSLSKGEVLSCFVSDLRQSVGAEDCAVLVASPGLSVFSDDTAPYYANPLTFGETGACPFLMPSTLGDPLNAGTESLSDPAAHPYDAVKLALNQIGLRLRLIEEDAPYICPWLQAYDYASRDITEQIRAVTDVSGDNASYILYNPQGTYDFAALTE